METEAVAEEIASEGEDGCVGRELHQGGRERLARRVVAGRLRHAAVGLAHVVGEDACRTLVRREGIP